MQGEEPGPVSKWKELRCDKQWKGRHLGSAMSKWKGPRWCDKIEGLGGAMSKQKGPRRCNKPGGAFSKWKGPGRCDKQMEGGPGAMSK